MSCPCRPLHAKCCCPASPSHLAELGIQVETVDHPAVFTVADSAELDRRIPSGHTKNLFLKDAKGALFLVVAWAHSQVDLKALAVRLVS